MGNMLEIVWKKKSKDLLGIDWLGKDCLKMFHCGGDQEYEMELIWERAKEGKAFAKVLRI